MPVKREASPNPSFTSSLTPPATPLPKTTPKKAKPSSKARRDTAASPGKKMGPWSGEELKQLYAIMCPKQTGVKWNEVARQIPGRDAKSCTNKWSRMQGKIQQAIESLGE